MAPGTEPRRPRGPTPPTRFVQVVAVLVAVWCAVFAMINFWFEVTDHFASGPYAADAAALSVANWYVFVVKLVGVAAAVLSIIQPPRFLNASVVGVLLWGAFATVAIYVLGSLAEAAVMITGSSGDATEIDAAAIAYVFAFLLGAVGFGILAISYARRASLGKRELLVGLCGAPLLLGSVLVLLPSLLRAAGLLES